MSIASQLSFSTATSLLAGAAGSIPYQSATSSTTFLSIGTNGYVLTSNGSAPYWAVSSGGGGASTSTQTTRQTANASYYPTFVDANNATATGELFWTTSSFVVNPQSGAVSIGGLTVNGVSSLNGRTTAKDTINADTSYPFGIQNGSQQPWWLRALTTTNKFTLHLNGTGDLVTVDTSGLVTVEELSVDGVYNSPLQELSLTLGTESWVKLATLVNRCFAVFRVATGSNNSEEEAEIEIAGNYVLTPSAITVKRMTYNGHLREVRVVQSAGGAAKVVYIRVRTTEFAPTVRWRLINTLGFTSIHNVVETPAAGESVLVVNNVDYVTSYNYTVRSLGIGTTSSGVVGEIRASNEITAYYSSDIRLKENIKLIENPITIVNQIRGVYYDWTDEHIQQRGGEDGYFVRKQDIGVIAQEVEAVLPEIVATREDGIKVVKYEKLVALLIEAVKDQQRQINQISQAVQNMAVK